MGSSTSPVKAWFAKTKQNLSSFTNHLNEIFVIKELASCRGFTLVLNTTITSPLHKVICKKL